MNDRRETPALELRGIVAGYDRSPVLDDVSITVGAGQTVGLFGPNGSGKSTVVRTILGYVQPWAGSILCRGKDITGWRPHQVVRLGVNTLFQHTKIFRSLTVEENVRLRLHNKVDPGILSDGDSSPVWRLLPELSKVWREPARNLSGGQAQRLALALVLHGDAGLWIVTDEPSIALPDETFATVLALLDRKKEAGQGVLIIEHRVFSVLGWCDHAYFLRGGKVALEGVGPDLETDPRVRAVYFPGVTVRGARTDAGLE